MLRSSASDLLWRVVCACCLLSFPPGLAAYSVSPSLLQLRPTGQGASAFLHLANRTAHPVALDIAVHPHGRDLEGRALPLPREEASDDILVYPSQLVLLPGDAASAQIRWIGPPALDRERAYTLVTRQVPIPRDQAEPEPSDALRIDVTVLMNYEVRLYVTPPGAAPRMVIESVSAHASAPDDPEAGLEIMLHNLGAARISLAGKALRITSATVARGGPAATIPAADVPALKTPILAGERRRVIIPRPASLPPGALRASLVDPPGHLPR